MPNADWHKGGIRMPSAGRQLSHVAVSEQRRSRGCPESANDVTGPVDVYDHVGPLLPPLHGQHLEHVLALFVAGQRTSPFKSVSCSPEI